MADPGRPKATDIKWKWTEAWEVYMFTTFEHIVFVLEYLFFNLFLVFFFLKLLLKKVPFSWNSWLGAYYLWLLDSLS